MGEEDEFKYLGYIFRKNGGQAGQVKERVRKAGGALRTLVEQKIQNDVNLM